MSPLYGTLDGQRSRQERRARVGDYSDLVVAVSRPTGYDHFFSLFSVPAPLFPCSQETTGFSFPCGIHDMARLALVALSIFLAGAMCLGTVLVLTAPEVVQAEANPYAWWVWFLLLIAVPFVALRFCLARLFAAR